MSPILSQRSPLPKSLFSMVVDIVQRVGSANWITNSVLDSQCVHVVQSIGLV